jgi:hypothetical protein
MHRAASVNKKRSRRRAFFARSALCTFTETKERAGRHTTRPGEQLRYHNLRKFSVVKVSVVFEARVPYENEFVETATASG